MIRRDLRAEGRPGVDGGHGYDIEGVARGRLGFPQPTTRYTFRQLWMPGEMRPGVAVEAYLNTLSDLIASWAEQARHGWGGKLKVI